jgi:hypothetical protein
MGRICVFVCGGCAIRMGRSIALMSASANLFFDVAVRYATVRSIRASFTQLGRESPDLVNLSHFRSRQNGVLVLVCVSLCTLTP